MYDIAISYQSERFGRSGHIFRFAQDDKSFDALRSLRPNNRYCEGVHPALFLNISLNADNELNPASYAIAEIFSAFLEGSDNSRFASSTLYPFI
jgi:hypothetical protein